MSANSTWKHLYMIYTKWYHEYWLHHLIHLFQFQHQIHPFQFQHQIHPLRFYCLICPAVVWLHHLIHPFQIQHQVHPLRFRHEIHALRFHYLIRTFWVHHLKVHTGPGLEKYLLELDPNYLTLLAPQLALELHDLSWNILAFCSNSVK